MLTAPPSNADQAIAMLLADPLFAPLVTAHRELEPRPPRHAPWPKGVDGRIVNALRGRGVEALYTHQAAAYEAASARRNFVVVDADGLGQDALLQPAGPRRGREGRCGAGALPLPHQGPRGGPAR